MEIARLNGIANPNLIAVGQLLKVPGSTVSTPPVAPSSGGTSYTVLPGDTLAAISVTVLNEGSRWRDIAALNGISNPSALRIGQVLQIPDADSAVVVPPAPAGGQEDSGWRWPTDSQRVTSQCGTHVHPITGETKQHRGLDIGASSGSNVYATRSGTVSFAGWPGGDGTAVYVDHAGGIEGRYAHCSSLVVSSGDKVTQSRVIAKVGSTGNSTGPHLHFEIRSGGATRNPQDYV
ncbi:MAG: murein DD-endopeptidase MepM/ murein hydrolase activator NlpD [Myxococcota bacterium]|jgi:murein DD-endopeptidase MepM/ murein hydrolase activator NlpD